MIGWLIFVALVILLLIEWWRMKPFYWKHKGIPYTTPLAVIGSNLSLFFQPFHVVFNKKYKAARHKGGLHGLHNFLQPALMVTDPEIVKEICVNQSDIFSSRGIYTNSKIDPLAINVFHSSGEQWKNLRNKLSPQFSPLKLKYTTLQMSTNMEEFRKQLEDVADTNISTDMNTLSLKLSTDVVVNTIFGIKPDSFTNPKSFFFKLQEELFGHIFVIKVLIGTVAPFLYDLLRLTIIPKITTLKLKGFVEEVMDQRIKNIGVRQDFIQGMVDMVQKDSGNTPDGKTTGFTKNVALAQCMVMFLGGTETTGNTISYLFHELAIHQEIQNKVRAEINRVVTNADGGVFTYEHFNRLTYTNMVINESLRKYPILPVITRKCTKATRIGGIDIEPDTYIYIPVMGIHWDPEYYPNPERFLPERFAADAYMDNAKYMPFGLGPRKCIGWKMALIEIAYAMCEILPKFRILPSEKTKSQIMFSRKPTLNPKDGVWLIVERI